MLGVLDALVRVRAAQGEWLAAAGTLRAAVAGLEGRVPAMVAALNAGRPAWDGRTQDEIDARRRWAKVAAAACLVCDGVPEAPARLRSGLCPADFARWVEARGGGADRGVWVAGARAALVGGELCAGRR